MSAQGAEPPETPTVRLASALWAPTVVSEPVRLSTSKSVAGASAVPVYLQNDAAAACRRAQPDDVYEE
jgi:hypothetical protein